MARCALSQTIRRHAARGALCLIPATLAVLLAVLWALNARADTEMASALLAQQQAYFQKITSIQFDARSVLQYSEYARAKGAPVASHKKRLAFLCAGRRFRSRVSGLDINSGKTMAWTYAFDGSKYQALEESATVRWLSTTRIRNTDTPYGGVTNPIVDSFGWAFLPGDEISLAQLQRSDQWEKLAQRVRGCEAAHWTDPSGQAHEGVRLTLERDEGDMPFGRSTYDVFFSTELDTFPIFWQLTDPTGGRGDYWITETQPYSAEVGAIRIPTRFEWQGYSPDGKPLDSGYA